MGLGRAMLLVTAVSLATAAFPVQRLNFKGEPKVQHEF